jgi:L-cystine uptake protein TcyP (sodium:dicarboxylate symporter family)
MKGLRVMATTIIAALLGVLLGHHLRTTKANQVLQGTHDEAARP